MKRSSERILTTHAGSLPRPADLLDVVERDGAKAFAAAAAAARLRADVADIVRKQAELGIDVVDDGEFGKPSFVSFTFAATRATKTSMKLALLPSVR